MPIHRRASARFFVAFYQWHRCVEGRARCLSLVPRTYVRSYTPNVSNILSSSTGHLESSPPKQEDAVIPRLVAPKGGLKNDGLEEDSCIDGSEEEAVIPRRVASERGLKNDGPEEEGSWMDWMDAREEEDVEGARKARQDVPSAPDEESLLQGYLEMLEAENRTTDQEDTDPLRDDVRILMRRVPHSVVVLTAAAPHPHVDAPLGLAVSSFNTVTLDPPMISFNIKHPSQTLDAIRADQGRFRIHFLSASHKTANITRSFTQGNHEEAFQKRRKLAKMDTSGTEFSRAARIVHPGVTASMQCELTQEVEVGDHIIAVGKVLSMDAEDGTEPLLMYVGGNFMESSGNVLAPVTTKQEPTKGKDWHPLYSLPLFPGEADRKQFKEDLIQYINADSGSRIFRLGFSKARACLLDELDIIEGPLGIRLYNVIIEAAYRKRLKGKKKKLSLDHHISGLLQCPGPPSPSDMEQVIERAKKLVRRDPSYLDLDAAVFLALLGLSMRMGTLASDILNPLRAEGLIPAFQPVEASIKAGPLEYPRIHDLEQLEHRTRELMQRVGPKIENKSIMFFTDQLAERAMWARQWISNVRTRMYMNTFPAASYGLEFSGHLTLPEARVAVSRILTYLHSDPDQMETRLYGPSHGILLASGVHPLVTGFDAQFLLHRLKRSLNKYNRSKYHAYVRELKESHFVKTVSVQDFQRRVVEVVDGALVRAVDWSPSDLLLAAGVDPEAHLVLENGATEKLTLPVIVRAYYNALRHREMYDRYYDLRAEERNAVERFSQRFGQLLGTGADAERLSGLPRTGFPEDEAEFLEKVQKMMRGG